MKIFPLYICDSKRKRRPYSCMPFAFLSGRKVIIMICCSSEIRFVSQTIMDLVLFTLERNGVWKAPKTREENVEDDEQRGRRCIKTMSKR